MNNNNSSANDLFVAMQENKKIWHLLFSLAIAAFSFMLFMAFMSAKGYYALSDALYYFSIAKNLHENGLFADLVTNGRIFTPQNGIVFLHYILIKIGLSPQQTLMTATTINYVALLLSVFPLLGIMKYVGIRSCLAKYSVIAFYLCAWPFLTVQLFPQNEGLFVAANIWLIYLITRLYQYKYNEITAAKIPKRICVFSCIALSVIAIHFRLNIIFVPIAAMFAMLLTQKYRTIPFLVILTVIMLISLIIPYALVETNIDEYAQSRSLGIIQDFKGTILNFCFHAFPASIYRDFSLHANALYLPIFFCLIAAFITGFKRKEYLKLMLLFICFFTYGLVIIYGFYAVRYLIIVTPLVFIIMLNSKYFRSIAYLFIFAAVSTSLWSYYDGIRPTQLVDFWSHVSETTEFEGDDPMLIAAKVRHCWFFTGIAPQYPKQQWTILPPQYQKRDDFVMEDVEFFTWDELIDRKTIYLAGHKDYIEVHGGKIKQMAKENNYKARFKVVTPLYKEHLVTRVFLEANQN